MRIVFFGTSEFAFPSLEAILKSHHQVLAVVTQPDRKQGRKLLVSSPPVKILSNKYNLEIHQPNKVSAPDFINTLKNYNAEVFIVVSFGQILSNALLKIPQYFSINLHGSLLPKYRGPAPVNWAIINGETTTGVSVIKMERKVDSGDILLEKEIKIDTEDNALTLSKKLSNLGAPLLIQALDLLKSGKAFFRAQEEEKVTFAPKLKKTNGLINWSEEALKIHNKVRGLFPWPGTFVNFNNKILKILETKIVDSEEEIKASPGTIIQIINEGLLIQTGQGQLLINQVQLAGAKPMTAKQFTLGHQISMGTGL